MTNDDSKVIVLGGAGYIGSHICKLLSSKGYEVVVYDNLSTGNSQSLKWGEFVEGDIADEGKLRRAISDHRPSAIMHFAASSLVGESNIDPLKYYQNNLAGSFSVIKAMLAEGCENLIFSSSCAIFGECKEKIKEDSPINPKNIYGYTKSVTEKFLDDCDKSYGIKSVCLRYFNAAGADPEGEIGEWHNPETHLIPLVINKALDSNSDLTVFGADYDTADGTCVRDYIHVLDLAEAHILAMEKLKLTNESKKINLGIGEGYSVMEIINAVKHVSGINFDFKIGDKRAGDPPSLVSDNKLAKSYLDWQPQKKLEDQIRDAFNWHKGGGFAS